MWRFPSRYADPGSLSILSRITLHLIDDADRAVLGDTLAHIATYRLVEPLRLPIYNVDETSRFDSPILLLHLILFRFSGVSLGHKYYERPRPSRRAGLLATSIGPRYWSTFARANLAIDCQVAFIGRPLERSLSTQIS